MQGNMKGQYLGRCLDSCRWGSQTTVMYEMTVRDMISFIENWMHQNDENFQDLWHERTIEELFEKFELPHIHHENCPVKEYHIGTIEDLGRRIRCSYKLKPITNLNVCYAILSDKQRILSLETVLNRLNLRPKFKRVYINPELGINEPRDLMSESNSVHMEPNDKVEFPFDGWDLAFYVQKWYEQLPNGTAPVFEK